MKKMIEVDAHDLAMLLTASSRYVAVDQGLAPRATQQWATWVGEMLMKYGPTAGIVIATEPEHHA